MCSLNRYKNKIKRVWKAIGMQSYWLKNIYRPCLFQMDTY